MLMNKQDLDITLLRTFAAVAEREHFGAAAQAVYRTQAAVSQQMQRLEALVGCSLFVRVGRSKRLTEEGTRLLSYARRILSLNDEAYGVMTNTDTKSVVKIGVSADCVDSLMPEYLARCAEHYPRLRIDIQVGRSRWLGATLRRGDLDLVLDVENHDGLPCHALRTSPIIWLAGARFHPRRNVPLPLVLMQSTCSFRQTAITLLEQGNRPWRIAFETTTLAGIRAALRAGLGVTARSIEMLTPDLKIVDQDLGLPQLPSISYKLFTHGKPGNRNISGIVRIFTGRL